MATHAKLEASHVNVRIKISALWTSMLFVFAYVDIFSLYRPDFRADLEAEKIGDFTINQAFLVGTIAYIVIPALMVFLALVLRPQVDRVVNIALAAGAWPQDMSRTIPSRGGVKTSSASQP
jgi:Family of unknown function (DUF6326)